MVNKSKRKTKSKLKGKQNSKEIQKFQKSMKEQHLDMGLAEIFGECIPKFCKVYTKSKFPMERQTYY